MYASRHRWQQQKKSLGVPMFQNASDFIMINASRHFAPWCPMLLSIKIARHLKCECVEALPVCFVLFCFVLTDASRHREKRWQRWCLKATDDKQSIFKFWRFDTSDSVSIDDSRRFAPWCPMLPGTEFTKHLECCCFKASDFFHAWCCTPSWQVLIVLAAAGALTQQIT